MSKYLVLAHDDEGNELSMAFEFDNSEHKFLKSWSVAGEWMLGFWHFVWKNPPLTQDVLLKWNNPLIREIREVPEDLTFARFWDLYDYKVGDKKKAEKAWNNASEADKIAALAGIPKYKFWLSTCTTAQAHAVTFLNQRRYENDFSTKKK